MRRRTSSQACGDKHARLLSKRFPWLPPASEQFISTVLHLDQLVIRLVFMLRPFVRKAASGDSGSSCSASPQHSTEPNTPSLMRKWKSTYVLRPSDHLAAVICWCRFGKNRLICGSRFQCRKFQECKRIRVGASVLDTCMCARHLLGSSLICSDVDLPN